MDITQTNRSHTRVGSHMSQKWDDEQAMQWEINDLKRRLRFAQRRQSPPPPAQTHLSTTKMMMTIGESLGLPQARLSPTRRSVTNGTRHDAMSRALNQFSRSPFTRRIEWAAFPRRFQ